MNSLKITVLLAGKGDGADWPWEIGNHTGQVEKHA